MVGSRGRRVRLAVELSLLLHVVLVWLAPHAQSLAAAVFPMAQVKATPPPAEDKPLRFEVVDLPAQREEKPSRADAPASDLSRRAHGGEGDPSTVPGTRGNTPELRLSPAAPSRVPPAAAAAPSRGSSPTRGDRAGNESAPSGPATTGEEPQAADAGAATVLRPQPAQRGGGGPVLRGLSPLSVPPGGSGSVPDHPGGQVDLGPLSFDTQWYDWGAYAAEMLRRIRYHWNIPELAKLGVEGVVRVHFTIERDGSVSALAVQRESGHPPMDFAARDAILNASPLPPLPADLVGVQHEGVSITFYYNVRPPGEAH